MNILAIAYLGDSVYELYIRSYLLKQGIYKVKDLQKESLKYVSATSQRKHIERLLAQNFLKEREIETYKRGRNAHSRSNKSSDIITYKMATGLECIIGQLYLDKNYQRLKEIMDFIVEE